MTARPPARSTFFFFNDTATTEIYTLSLHDALPIYLTQTRLERLLHAEQLVRTEKIRQDNDTVRLEFRRQRINLDRKSTRLNSSHQIISYAVFCLKKKTP